jgi:hypothetical protein
MKEEFGRKRAVDARDDGSGLINLLSLVRLEVIGRFNLFATMSGNAYQPTSQNRISCN